MSRRVRVISPFAPNTVLSREQGGTGTSNPDDTPEFFPPVVLAATVAIPTCTYYNGPNDDGVGATLTGDEDGVLTIDEENVDELIGAAVGIFAEADEGTNGIYIVTQPGDEETPFILTRASYADLAVEFAPGTLVSCTGGHENFGAIFMLWSETPEQMGTDPILFNKIGPYALAAGPGIALEQDSGITTVSTSGPITDSGFTIGETDNGALAGRSTTDEGPIEEIGIGSGLLIVDESLRCGGSFIASGFTMSTARLLGRTTAGTGAPEEISTSGGISYSAGNLTLGGLIANSGLTMATNRLLGRTDASTGALQQIMIGAGLTFTGQQLSVTVATVTAPALLNSWANVGSGLTTAGYYKSASNIVDLQGTISGGADGSIAFNIPAGFRPGATLRFITASDVGGAFVPAYVSIATNGDVTIVQTEAGAERVSLDGINFLATV